MQLINGDITKEKDGYILHGVNCRGVMGSGVALAIKTKWPKIYKRFIELYEAVKSFDSPSIMLGKIDVVEIHPSTLYVINGYTQNNYGKDGKRYASVEAIDTVLKETFFEVYRKNELLKSENKELILKTVKIGCGLGGLSWDDEVEPLFQKHMGYFPNVKVQIFEF